MRGGGGLRQDGCTRSQDSSECVQKSVADADNEIKEMYHPARHLLSSTPHFPRRLLSIPNEIVPTGLLKRHFKIKAVIPMLPVWGWVGGASRPSGWLMVKHCHTPRALGYK